MAKVYTTVPGAVVEIGHYGSASNEAAAVVPDEVAAELAGRGDLRVEREEFVPILYSSSLPAEEYTFHPHRAEHPIVSVVSVSEDEK